MSKYYKYQNGLIVKWLRDKPDGYFTGTVMSVGVSEWKMGEKCDDVSLSWFYPYTPTPQELIEWGETATLTNDNPNKAEVDDKDVNLRLECLKLAIASNVTDPQVLAQEFYDWIKNH